MLAGPPEIQSLYYEEDQEACWAPSPGSLFMTEWTCTLQILLEKHRL